MTRLFRYENYIKECYDVRAIRNSRLLTAEQKRQVLAYMKDDAIRKRYGEDEKGKETRFYVFDKRKGIKISGVRPLKDRVQTWKYYSIADMFNPEVSKVLRKAQCADV